MTAASLTQSEYRGRDDSEILNSPTFTYAINTPWSQNVNEVFRVRFGIQETAGGMENVTFKCQFNYDSGGYTDITTGTAVRVVASSRYTDGEPTTKRMNGTGTFVAGVGDASDNLMPSAGNITFNANFNSEVEICLQINGPSVENAKNVLLRLVRSSGTVLEGYTNTPSITTVKAAGVPSMLFPTLSSSMKSLLAR